MNPQSGSASILKQGQPILSELKASVLTGLRKGFGFGILVTLLGIWLLAINGYGFETRRMIIPYTMGAGIILGVLISWFYYLYECRYGFLRVDDENILYWNLFRIIKIPLQDVFGAGPEKRKVKEYLRLCFLAENARGFSNRLKNFKYYDAVSGPVTKLNTSGMDGNQLARMAIIEHIRRRLNRKQKVAEMPEYRFDQVAKKKYVFRINDINVITRFSCDGKVLLYDRESENVNVTKGPQTSGGETPDELLQNYDYRIPVREIIGVEFFKSTTAGIGSAVYISLDLRNPSDADTRFKLDVGIFKRPREIGRYCQCLPTLFPDYGDLTYWEDGY